MSKNFATTADPALRNIGLPSDRNPQRRIDLGLPADFTTVSVDGHTEISDDVFVRGFPAALKDRAPRVWFDKYWHIGTPQREVFIPSELVEKVVAKTLPSGSWDLDVRLEHLDIEGVDKEILYPQSLLGFARYGDFEVHEHLFRVYNEYIAERCAAAPGRFYGVGVCSNWWDPAKAHAAVRQIVDLGLKTFMLPGNPGKHLNGKAIAYGSVEMEPFWSEVESAGLPVSFHTGENPEVDFRGGLPSNLMINLGNARKPLAQLIFGGVFDRNPKLKIVFAEYGLSWVIAALQDAEKLYDSFGNGEIDGPVLKHRPSYYWHNNCYATFMNDLFGLNNLEYIGADRVMWSSDYPHAEGSFGVTWSSMESVVKATTPEIAQKILGGTAMELYGL